MSPLKFFKICVTIKSKNCNKKKSEVVLLNFLLTFKLLFLLSPTLLQNLLLFLSISLYTDSTFVSGKHM